ncbi:MAG: ORF6N domain-containing protein [Lachnospiraceae bacterium]|nr:ORF6N domain-containing protein [Lachnospiraceae bacterium]
MESTHKMNDNVVTTIESIDKEEVKAKIYEVRGHRVMLDSDIAMYFAVTTGNLNKAKNRNIERFPEHFCFMLTDQELSIFQYGIAMQTKGIKGGRSNNPTVYTEHGVAMLTSVLHTPRAISASIQIIEAFVEMSHYIRQNRELLPYDELKALELKH